MKFLLLIFAVSLGACAHPNLAYITNQGDNTVSVIDIAQSKVISSIEVGKAVFFRQKVVTIQL